MASPTIHGRPLKPGIQEASKWGRTPLSESGCRRKGLRQSGPGGRFLLQTSAFLSLLLCKETCTQCSTLQAKLDAAAEKANPVLDSIDQSTGSQLREGTAPLPSTLGMWQVASGIQFWAGPFRKELANRSCDEKGLGRKRGAAEGPEDLQPGIKRMAGRWGSICHVEDGAELFRVGPDKAR